MQITNGTVEYGRTVKPADYEARSAKLTLSFAVDETEANPDQVVAKVFDMAMAEVHRRLGLSSGGNIDYAKAAAPTAKVEKTAAQVVKLSAAEVKGLSEKGAAAAPQPDPMNMTPSTAAPAATEPKSPAAVTAVPSADPLAITPPATAPVDTSKPVTITDNDLHAAVHQAVERKVLPAQVRELTAEITGVVGQSMTTIPQEKRPTFLARVKELRPNA